MRYGRDVVPLSPAVREANRRNYVVPRDCPWGSIGITNNDWFAFLSQQSGYFPSERRFFVKDGSRSSNKSSVLREKIDRRGKSGKN